MLPPAQDTIEKDTKETSKLGLDPVGTDWEFIVREPFTVIDLPDFPSDAPAGHPHVLKLPNGHPYMEEYPHIRMADAVATVLYHYRRTALKQFFDMKIDSCIYHWTKTPADQQSSIYCFIIERKERDVFVS